MPNVLKLAKGEWSTATSRILTRSLQDERSVRYLLYVPGTGGLGAPVFVSVHGVSRNAREHAVSFAPYCEKYGVVLVVPIFSQDQFPDYQRLGREGKGLRADLALDAILAEVAATTGAAAAHFHLFGYSGGAQFAQRYTFAHPHRIAGAVIAAAGWYTFPDPSLRFPYGIRPTRKLPGARFDAEEFLSVPMTLIVGASDGGERAVRRNRRLDAQQGVTRVERSRRWVAAMRNAAEVYQMESLVTYEEVEGYSHSFRRFIREGVLGSCVFEALFGAPPVASARASGEPRGRAEAGPSFGLNR